MRSILYKLTRIYPTANYFHLTMFLFRVIVSLELIIVHGLKKAGIGVAEVELIPNPLHLPQHLNEYLAIGVNLIAPAFIIIGLLTRLAIIPVLAVILTDFFVLPWNDALLVNDVPFIYSAIFLLILILGPGKYSIDYFINKNQQL